MAFENVAFWLFLASVTVASLTFVAIVVWVSSRFQERKEYYRFEFRKRLVESGKMDAEAFGALMRYEHDLKLRQSREKLLIASFVILGLGVGTCVGLLFLGQGIWMVGLIPASMGFFMLLYGLVVAAKPNPGPAPLGWSPEANERD